MKIQYVAGACLVVSALLCGIAGAQQQPRIGGPAGPAGPTGTLPPAQVVQPLLSIPAGITIAEESCTGQVGSITTGRQGKACTLTATMACLLRAGGNQAARGRCVGGQGSEGSTRIRLFEDLAQAHELRVRAGSTGPR